MADLLSVRLGTLGRVSSYDPYLTVSANPGWTLAWHPLPDGESGRWYQDLQTMVIDPRLSQAERRSTVAHEVEHALAGDEACPEHPMVALRQERAADDLAARRLIPLDRLLDALLWCRDDYTLAAELWVDVATIRARLDGLIEAEHAWLTARLAEAERVMETWA